MRHILRHHVRHFGLEDEIRDFHWYFERNEFLLFFQFVFKQ
jgi:hypothetical protein